MLNQMQNKKNEKNLCRGIITTTMTHIKSSLKGLHLVTEEIFCLLSHRQPISRSAPRYLIIVLKFKLHKHTKI